MKTKIYIRTIMALAVAAAASACSENAWNNHLNGFEEMMDEPLANVQSIEYTLTAADYTAIASNTTNVALAGDEGKAALAAVGSQRRFSSEAPASEYVPAWLGSTAFPYFTLTQGSAVKITYNMLENADPVAEAATGAQMLTVPGSFYQEEVWESDENYVDAFAPSRPAADYIPEFLADEADANDGIYAVVQYRMATQEPVFGGGGTSGPTVNEIFSQTFTEDLGAFTIDNKVLPAELEYVWSWGGANYGAKASAYIDGVSYATESWLISPEIDLAGATAVTLTFEHVVNKFPDLEFAKANCTLWARESGTATWTEVAIPTYTDNTSWTFTASGDISLAAFDGKKIQLAFKYVSEDGKSGTWEVKNLVVKGTFGGDAAPAMRAAAQVPVQTLNAVYFYNGSKWEVPADMAVLQPADYTAMGQTHTNLTAAEPFVSTWLNINYPYAAADDAMNVLWLRYAGGSTSYVCSNYIHDGSTWKANTYITETTEQFVMTPDGWIYNPNVTINLPAGKNQPLSTLYFQTCVDWVFENICKPLGDTNIKSGLYYVSSYGNNEYYSGTSAYQGNIDLRPSAARAQYPAEYSDMTDEDIIALEKSRFMNEVMPGALAILHADAKPLQGADLLYTINFYIYNGSATLPHTAIFKVTAPGTFEPVSCTWDEE